MPSFMMSVRVEVYKALEKLANQRGISVQELIRAVIIPDWLIGKEIILQGKKTIFEE